MRIRPAVLDEAVHDDGSADRVVLDGVGQKVDENLLQPRPVGVDEVRDLELGKGHADTALLRLRLYHRLAFAHDLGQRYRLQRQRQLPRLDQREIEDFVDQVQQVPSCLENLIDAALLRDRRRRSAGFHELGKAENGAQRRAQLVAHAGKEIGLREVGVFRDGHRVVQLQLDLLAHGIVGADQQVSDDVAVIVAQRGDRHDGRKAAAILADVGQFIAVLDPARRLESQRLEAGLDGRGKFLAQRLRPRHHFLRVMDVAGADLVDDFGGQVAQHALGADIEQLNDAFFVGGDDREIGAGENGVLQRPRLEQRFLAPHLGDAIRPAGSVGNGGNISCNGHGRIP